MAPCNIGEESARDFADPVPGAGDPEPTCSFVLPAQLAAAWASRTRIRRWLESWSLTGDLVEDIVYMTSEAVSNSAEHAYSPEDTDGRIRVRAAIRPEPDGQHRDGRAGRPSGEVRIQVSVRDFGRWRQVDPSPTHRGHGLAAIAALAGEVTIRRHEHGPDAGTEVVLLSTRTRLPAAAPHPARTRG